MSRLFQFAENGKCGRISLEKTVLQISGLNDKTGSKSGVKRKMQVIQAIHLSSEFQKKCETMIHIFTHRKGQTYEQIKVGKKTRLFLFPSFNPVSPANSD